MQFHEALMLVERGYRAWAAKPHNRRWFRRIDGTPIPNDLCVVIATTLATDLRCARCDLPMGTPGMTACAEGVPFVYCQNEMEPPPAESNAGVCQGSGANTAQGNPATDEYKEKQTSSNTQKNTMGGEHGSS